MDDLTPRNYSWEEIHRQKALLDQAIDELEEIIRTRKPRIIGPRQDLERIRESAQAAIGQLMRESTPPNEPDYQSGMDMTYALFQVARRVRNMIGVWNRDSQALKDMVLLMTHADEYTQRLDRMKNGVRRKHS